MAGIVPADACARLRRVASPPVAVTPLRARLRSLGRRRSSRIRTRSTGGSATSIRSCGTPPPASGSSRATPTSTGCCATAGLGRTYLHQATHAEMGRPEPPAWHAPFHELNDAGMLDLEPPDHTRLRRLVLKAFTPRTVEAMRTADPGDRRRPDRRHGRAPGEVDLIADFVEPLPVTVIAELLGIPEADRHLLRPWSADICLMYELDPPEASARKAVQASIEFGGVPARPARRTAAPAGRRPDQRPRRGRRRRRHADRDRADRDLRPAPERRPRGVGQRRRERLVDALPPSRRARPVARRAGPPADRDRGAPAVRHAAVAVRALGPRADRGRRRRDPGAARRSRCCSGRPTATPTPSSDPDDLDLARDPNPYLSFGAGIHYCLGAPLAKLELGDRVRDAAAAARRGSSSSRRRAGSRPSSCAGSSRSGSGSSGGAACATSRSATRTPSAPRSRPPSAGRSGWSRRSGRLTPHGWSWWPTSGSTAPPRPT